MSQDSLSGRISAWMLGHPRKVALVLGGLILGSAALLPGLRIVTGWESFYDRNVPEQKVLDEVEAHFVNDDLLYVAYQAQDVFSAQSLEAVRRTAAALQALTVAGPEGAEQQRAVDDITSLTDVKDLVGSDMSFRTEPLVPTPVPTQPQALERIRQRARANPLIRDNLLARKDDTAAALVLRLAPGLSDRQISEAVDDIRGVLADAGGKGGVERYYLMGKSAIITDTGHYTQQDLMRFIPIIYAVIVVVLFTYLRRRAGLLLALTNVTLSLLGGMAILVAVGGAINDLSATMPSIVMILSVASIIHFLSELGKNAREHGEDRAAQITVSELLGPQFMCSLTTCVGFCSLATARIPAVRQFGIACGLSVMFSYVVSFCLVSLVARRRNSATLAAPDSVALARFFEKAISAYGQLVIRRRWLLFVLSAAAFAGLTFGVSRLHVETNHLDYFSDAAPIKQSNAFIEQHLGGTTVLVISLKSQTPDRFLDPSELKKVEALETFLEKELGATSVTSPAAHIKLMHRAFLNEDPAAYRIPDTREQVAQLLLLNGDKSLREYLDGDRRWARLTLRVSEHGIAKVAGLYERIDAYLAEHFPARDGYTAASTGQFRLVVTLVSTIVDSQTNSLGLSFVLIFLPIILLFRSVKAGLFSIPSNIFPIGVTLGVMGWTGVPLNIATVMISSITLGIAVDDTIHFIAYLRTRLAEHGDLERGLQETFQMKGAGVFWTALIISLGFSVVLVSNFGPVRHFGVLTCLAMVSGLVGELFLLPPLMLITRTRLGVPDARASQAAQSVPDAGAIPVPLPVPVSRRRSR